MSTIYTLVTTCDKNKGEGVVTPVRGVEFPKGTCPCHGCYAKYNLEFTGEVKSTTGDRNSEGEVIAFRVTLHDSLL